MKRTLLFMTERLQIEGELQVNLIPASSIVIHLGQTKNQLQGEVGDCVILLIACVWMQKSQEVEAKEPVFCTRLSQLSFTKQCLFASNYLRRIQCYHLLFTRKRKLNFYCGMSLKSYYCPVPACPSHAGENLDCSSSLALPDSLYKHPH